MRASGVGQWRVCVHASLPVWFSPSGDSSWTYVPVKYLWTSADFPLARFPTMPWKRGMEVRGPRFWSACRRRLGSSPLLALGPFDSASTPGCWRRRLRRQRQSINHRTWCVQVPRGGKTLFSQSKTQFQWQRLWWHHHPRWEWENTHTHTLPKTDGVF